MPYYIGKVPIYRIGEPGSCTKLRSGSGPFQDFLDVRTEYKGRLFEDPEFVPSNKLMVQEPGNLFWKRPSEIQREYYKDGRKVVFEHLGKGEDAAISRYDIHQGGLGDCGTLAAFGSAMLQASVKRIVFHPHNSFDDDAYCGAFCFRFYRMGRWLDVVVDDRIPVDKDSSPHSLSPVTTGSGNVAEYWPCLLEKAWAKMAGSYQKLEDGYEVNQYESVSGGVFHNSDINQPGSFNNLLTAWRGVALGGLGVSKESEGMVSEHAYSITGVQEIRTEAGAVVQLVRLRNPWGNSEYTGKWSDSSKEWKKVDPATRKKLELSVADDGEFWIDYTDLENFSSGYNVCNLIRSELDAKDGDRIRRWNYNKFFGNWNDDHVYGYYGPSSQHRIEVESHDGKETQLVLSLLNLGTNYGMQEPGESTVGVLLFELKDNEFPCEPAYLAETEPVATGVDSFGVQLWVTQNVAPGSYCVVVYVGEAAESNGDEHDYVLRTIS